MKDDSQLRPVAGAMHDDMMLIAARAAPRIVAGFEDAGGTLRCRRLDFDESGDGTVKPELGFDPQARAQDLGRAATEARIILRRNGVVWSGSAAELIQLPRARAALRFLEGDRAVHAIEFGPGDPHAIMTNRFFDDVDRANRALALSAATLLEGAGGIRGYQLNQDRAVLALEFGVGPRELPLQFLASWSAESATLRWAWANPSFDIRCTSFAIAARDEKNRQGIATFSQPAIWCEPGVAQALTRTLAVPHARGVFPAQHDHGILFLALT
jgi:hypothetical protein